MKCSMKVHVFEEKGRKCLCGKADAYWFACARCGVAHVAKYKSLSCEDCLNDPEYRKEVKVANAQPLNTSGIKHYPEVTAFGHDTKTGRPYALTTKGKKIDPDQTRYNLDRDPHGWAATGKIPKKKTYYI